ncbi:hypothetical protein COLO4_31085 [Corchorus olitorius]|uniref:Uncharacterized protein n=1 Tax=Corchorus olitorius TaxID=93759 RepID=A0A1R3H5S9_9ROSI|nr:hypothetical protein COLO4_31085 [Corchorus olitorius]
MEVEASDMSVCTTNRVEKVTRLAVRDIKIKSVDFYYGEHGEFTELAVLDTMMALDYDKFLARFHRRERPMQIMNPRNTPFNFPPIEWMPIIAISQVLLLRRRFDGQLFLLQVNSSLSYDDYVGIVFLAVKKGAVVLNIDIFDKQIDHIRLQICWEEKLIQQARVSIERMLNQLSISMFSDMGQNPVDVEELESNEDDTVFKFKSMKEKLCILEKELKQYDDALLQLSDKSFFKEKMFTVKAKLRNLKEARMKMQAMAEQAAEEQVALEFMEDPLEPVAASANESDMHCISQLLDEPGEIVTIFKHNCEWPKDVKRYTVWGFEHMESLPCQRGDKVELAIIDELPSSEYKKIIEKAMEAGFLIINPREAPYYYPRVRWLKIHNLEELFSIHRDFEGQVILIFVDHSVPWNCLEEISYYAILKKYVIINYGPYSWSPENNGCGEITSAEKNLKKLKMLLQEKRKLYEAYTDHRVKELANLVPELEKMNDWLDQARSVLMPPKARVVNINFDVKLTKHSRSESQDTAYTATDLYHPNQDIPGSPMKKMKMEMD